MITAETIPETTEIEIKPEDADKLYSLIFGSKQFSPSALMAQTLAEYITQEDNLLPHQILKKNGRARENWYIWSKRKGFLDWWNGVIDGVFSKQRLGDLYSALYRRGLNNDTAAAKIFLQRYDPKYTERSQQDQRLSFQGYEPAAEADARDRMRKALTKPHQTLQDGPGSTIRALPIPEHPGDTRPLQVYGLPAPAIHTQSQSAGDIEPAQAQVIDDTHVANKNTEEQEGAGGRL